MLRVLPPSFERILQQERVVKHGTSLFNSFSSNVEKQVARFLLPVLPNF